MRNLKIIISLLSISLFVILIFGLGEAQQAQPQQPPSQQPMQLQQMQPASMPQNTQPVTTTTMPTNTNVATTFPQNGNTTITIPHITVTNTNGTNVDASDVQIINSYNFSSNEVNHIHFEINIKSLVTTQTSFPLNGSLNFSVTVDNINLQAAQQLAFLVKAMQSKDMSQQSQDQVVIQIMQILPSVITNNFHFNLDEVYTTQQGVFSNNIKLSYPPNAPLPTNSTDIQNNLQGSALIKISIQMFNDYLIGFQNSKGLAVTSANGMPAMNKNSMPGPANNMEAPIITFIKQSLNDAIKKGYIIQDKNDYVVSITLEKGTLRINGKPLDVLPMMEQEQQGPSGVSVMPTLNNPGQVK